MPELPPPTFYPAIDHIDHYPLILNLMSQMHDHILEAEARLAGELAKHPLAAEFVWRFEVLTDTEQPGQVHIRATPRPI